MNTMTTMDFPCTIGNCEREFASRQALLMHQRQMHKNQMKPRFERLLAAHPMPRVSVESNGNGKPQVKISLVAAGVIDATVLRRIASEADVTIVA